MKVTSNPSVTHIQARFQAGLALYRQGQLAQAQQIFDQVLKLQPRHFETLYMLALIAGQIGNFVESLKFMDKAIEVNPASAAAYANRGNALSALKRYQTAIESYDRALSIKPNDAVTYYNRGIALNESGQHQAAIESYDKAIALKPDYVEAYFNRGFVLNQIGQHQTAVDSYDKAIAITSDHAEAYSNRGVALHDLRQYQAAIDSYDKAVALKPNYAVAYRNRGDVLADLRQYGAAVKSYDSAIAIRPDYSEAYTHRGLALNELGQHQAAVDSYDKAIAIKPDSAEAYANRGIAMGKLKNYQAAIESYDRAISIDPNAEFVQGSRFQTKMEICDWRDIENEIPELIEKVQRNERASQPLSVLALSTSLSLQRRAARTWGNLKHPANSELGSITKRSRGKRIRIAYFSMDFRIHPVSFLTAELFETHDRARFEVYGFSFGPDTRDEMRIRLESAFDEFIDVRNKSDKEIAELARQMGIDIAIDLAGFTAGSRTGLFALRAAPLQVNYLGYPGTMGADYMDYLIADKQLIPEDARKHYEEKIVYLPSFQANDSKRVISDKVFTRKELGLPQSGFVFCCFNNSYKFTPSTFDSWMRILKMVDESVLFLYAKNESAVINLRMEASKRGVDANRLVFGKQLPTPEYLARYRAADLFLDTLPFNAGTTASDALWAGLPVLTCTGEAFASRMASSLLITIGLPELISTTQEEYVAMAVELVKNPERLTDIRQKLRRNRLTSPLFDTRLFAKHIEDAYTQMIERHANGLAPDHIYVERQI